MFTTTKYPKASRGHPIVKTISNKKALWKIKMRVNGNISTHPIPWPTKEQEYRCLYTPAICKADDLEYIEFGKYRLIVQHGMRTVSEDFQIAILPPSKSQRMQQRNTVKEVYMNKQEEIQKLYNNTNWMTKKRDKKTLISAVILLVGQ